MFVYEGEDFLDFDPTDDDSYQYYQHGVSFPGEDEDLSDGPEDDFDDHYCGTTQEELDIPNESAEYLLGGEDSLEGYAGDDEQCYVVQDLIDLDGSNEYILCSTLLDGSVDDNENRSAVQDLDVPNETDEHLLCDELPEGTADYEEYRSEAQDLDECLLCDDNLDGSDDNDDECWYLAQDVPDFSDERHLLKEFDDFAANQHLNESEELLCLQLMERLDVAMPDDETVAKSTAPKKLVAENDPHVAGENRSSTVRDDGDSGIDEHIVEGPAAPSAKLLSIGNGNATDSDPYENPCDFKGYVDHFLRLGQLCDDINDGAEELDRFERQEQLCDDINDDSIYGYMVLDRLGLLRD